MSDELMRTANLRVLFNGKEIPLAQDKSKCSDWISKPVDADGYTLQGLLYRVGEVYTSDSHGLLEGMYIVVEHLDDNEVFSAIVFAITRRSNQILFKSSGAPRVLSDNPIYITSQETI